MKQPEVAAVLQDHSARLLTQIAPLLTGFEANSVAMIGMMLSMVAEDWDRAAAIRVEENKAIRAIFQDAAAFVEDTELGGRLAALAMGTDEDLHLSSLDTVNDALRGALIELQALIERRGDAVELNEEIWAELARSVERRRVSLANF